MIEKTWPPRITRIPSIHPGNPFTVKQTQSTPYPYSISAGQRAQHSRYLNRQQEGLAVLFPPGLTSYIHQRVQNRRRIRKTRPPVRSISIRLIYFSATNRIHAYLGRWRYATESIEVRLPFATVDALGTREYGFGIPQPADAARVKR